MIPFQITDWEKISPVSQKGASGETSSRTWETDSLRMRIVEHSAGYLADHWCRKGHLLYCLKGEMRVDLKDGSSYILKEGMSFEVSDNLSEHRSFSENGVRLLIIDGDFLK